MAFDKSRYLTGYSIGVGGAVLCGERILLVRLALGRNAGTWAIPGGFVEPDEMIDAAILRELAEETGVSATIAGMLGMRGRVTLGENSAYFIFLLHAKTDEARPDNFEVDQARYFALDEALALPGLNALRRMVIEHVRAGGTHPLTVHPHPDFAANEYLLFL